MKRFFAVIHIFLVGLLPVFIFAQPSGYPIRGKVVDAKTGRPLVGANVVLLGTNYGTITDLYGEYFLRNIPAGRYSIQVSYLGYENQVRRVQVDSPLEGQDFQLTPTILRGEEVIITATRAVQGETPVAFSTLSREDIQTRYFAQDIPVMLSELPSSTYYSESGNGIGYNYLSIRGFGQRRISVMINGIPQNDPEDHNTYWVDFPDFLDNVEDIQVQRGAGSAFYGPPAIGGSLNILTTRFEPERKISFYSGYGTYDTQKYSLALNSGLLQGRYILYGRISQIKSDGYRRQSWVNFKSYFFGLARFGNKTSLRLQLYGGPIADHLAYYGIPRQDALNTTDTALRRQNPISRPDEIENFNQPHLELIHRYQLTSQLTMSNTLFAIRGYGFFDYDGSWAPLSYFRLTPQYGFQVTGDPEELYVGDLLIRAFVDNKQVGWLPNFSWKSSRVTVDFGGEIRFHRSEHWGRIQKGSSDLPSAVSGEYNGHNYIGKRRYYEYKGAKTILSPYLHSMYRLGSNLNMMFDLQISSKQYHLFREKYIGNDFRVRYNFLNPRLGINYNLTSTTNVFMSVSRTSREPRLKTLYDAAEASTPESWGAVVPQFEQRPDGRFDFSRPLVKPETLYDFEWGFGYRTPGYDVHLNLFYMDFQNEIVKKGQLDRFGQPVTGNAEKTLHTGIEFSAQVSINSEFSLTGNLTYSHNELKKYRVYGSDGRLKVLNGNPIAGFPDVLANARITFRKKAVTAVLSVQHVGKQYTDNFKNEAHTVPPYTVFNGMLGYNPGRFMGIGGLQFQVHIRNLFGTIYVLHGEGGEFFPAAERQIFSSVKVTL